MAKNIVMVCETSEYGRVMVSGVGSTDQEAVDNYRDNELQHWPEWTVGSEMRNEFESVLTELLSSGQYGDIHRKRNNTTFFDYYCLTLVTLPAQ